MRMRPGLPIVALALASACGEDRATLEIPRLGTTWVVVASAGGGRALVPSDVRVVKSTDLETLEIPGTGNVTVDMVFAGLRDEDLPAGLTADALVFATANQRNVRRIPPLVEPHVLAAPSPPGTAGVLVPVSELGLSDDEAEYRATRLAAMIDTLRIQDPCRASDAVFATPRIPATAVSEIRVLSSGEVYLALSATSTAIIGRFAGTDPREMEVVGVAMGASPVLPGEATIVQSLGDGEVMAADGVARPASLAITRGGALGHVAVMSAGEDNYRDETPRELDPAIGRASFAREITLADAPELCVGGQASGSGAMGSGARVGGLWCRTSTGGAWRVAAAIPGAQRLAAVLRPAGFRPLAIDYGGVVYTGEGEGRWTAQVTPAINQNCGAVACNRLDLAVPLPAASGALAAMAGDDGEAWVVRGTTDRALSAESLTSVSRALFGDEKKGGAAPLTFTAIATSPDGAVWIGSQAHFLVRVAPDLASAERVCLDVGGGDHPVTAIGAAADGRLIISTSPPIVGVGTWR